MFQTHLLIVKGAFRTFVATSLRLSLFGLASIFTRDEQLRSFSGVVFFLETRKREMSKAKHIPSNRRGIPFPENQSTLGSNLSSNHLAMSDSCGSPADMHGEHKRAYLSTVSGNVGDHEEERIALPSGQPRF